MFKLNKNPISFETDKRICKQEPHKKAEASPEQVAKWIMERSMDCMSVIVLCEPLAAGLNDMPYVDHQVAIGLSYAEQVAKLEAQERGVLPDQQSLAQVVRKRYPGLKRMASLNQAVARKRLESRVARAHYASLLPKVIFDFKQSFESEFLEHGGDRQELAVKWKEELIELLMPQVQENAVRRVSIPKPFHDIDSTQPWSQFYLVEKNDRMDYIVSNPSVPEVHQRWGQVFACLSGKMNYEVPTHILRYTSMNELKFGRSYERFKVVQDGLKVRAHYFDNKLVQYRDGELVDI